MKKIIIAILFATMMVFALAAPALAAGPNNSQVWYLYDTYKNR